MIPNVSSTFILVLFLSACGLAVSASPQRVGGPCTYKQYKGDAEIVSVVQRPGSSGEFDIKFSFDPQEAIREEFARVKDRHWFLVKNDSSYPKADFLKQYGVKAGKHFPCIMNVIIRGTCTPVLFHFPTIHDVMAK